MLLRRTAVLLDLASASPLLPQASPFRAKRQRLAGIKKRKAEGEAEELGIRRLATSFEGVSRQ